MIPGFGRSEVIIIYPDFIDGFVNLSLRICFFDGNTEHSVKTWNEQIDPFFSQSGLPSMLA